MENRSPLASECDPVRAPFDLQGKSQLGGIDAGCADRAFAFVARSRQEQVGEPQGAFESSRGRCVDAGVELHGCFALLEFDAIRLRLSGDRHSAHESRFHARSQQAHRFVVEPEVLGANIDDRGTA